MKPISSLRFNALGGYARQPQSILFGEEIRYSSMLMNGCSGW
jgi:hypothetical protein